MKSWNLTGPLELSASKLGAVEPRRRLLNEIGCQYMILNSARSGELQEHLRSSTFLGHCDCVWKRWKM
jgi:hypothetical protein